MQRALMALSSSRKCRERERQTETVIDKILIKSLQNSCT